MSCAVILEEGVELSVSCDSCGNDTAVAQYRDTPFHQKNSERRGILVAACLRCNRISLVPCNTEALLT